MIGSTRYIAAAEIDRQVRLSADISKLQQSISSGKRLAAGSDDPAAADRVAEIRQAGADQAIWSANADTGASIAGAADDRLGAVASALARAKELVLAGRNDSATAADRASFATELRGIVADLATYAQSIDPNGRALFPATAPIAIPVSDALSYTATDMRGAVFDTVAVASGTKSLADIITSAIGVLDSGNGAGISTSVAEIDAGIGHIASIRTDQGIRAQRFADVKERLAASTSDLSVERSALEDTDLTYALSEVQSKQLALQAAQTVFAQSHRSSLFDLLG